MKNLRAFLGFIAAFLVLDGIWISVFALDLYQSQIPKLMLDNPRMGFAAAFYLVYASAIVWLIIRPSKKSSTVLLNGAILGFLAYGTYTITNYAMLTDWTLTLVITDVLWGGFVTAICSLAGFYASGTSDKATNQDDRKYGTKLKP